MQPFMLISAVAFTDELARLSKASKALYLNQRESMTLRKLRKNSPDSFDYVAHRKLSQANGDATKLLSLGWVMCYSKIYTPFLLFFFPDMLPSTFDTPAVRSKRDAKLFTSRRQAVFEAVGADPGGTASAALNAPSKRAALDKVLADAGDKQIKDLPNPVFYAASRAFDGPYRIMPKVLHVRAIREGLKRIKDSDEALRRSQIKTLPADVLADACAERALGCTNAKDMVAGLNEWLALTNGRDDSDATRLALLGLNTASTIRQQDSGYVALYRPKHF